MQAASLVDALKRVLKGQGITYARIATGLGLSEAGVKRMFSRRDFTLQRLEDICRVARVDFAALMHAAAGEPSGLGQLTEAQERELVSDPRLMLVALCAIGNWSFEQIVDTYAIARADCTRYLARLDRYRIIELQKGNRIRPLISRTFSWRPEGPIQRYFHARVEAEFLGSRFDRRNELFLFVSGMLTRRTSAELVAKLKDLARDFGELHRADVAMPLGERHGTSLLLATRAWEPRAFRDLRRANRPPAPAGGALHSALVPSPPAVASRRRAK